MQIDKGRWACRGSAHHCTVEVAPDATAKSTSMWRPTFGSSLLTEHDMMILPVLCTMAVDAVALSPYIPAADTGVYSATITWSTSSCVSWYELQLAATTMLSMCCGCCRIQHTLQSPGAFSYQFTLTVRLSRCPVLAVPCATFERTKMQRV